MRSSAPRVRLLLLVLASGLCAGLSTGAAHAQNALGDGRGLENPLDADPRQRAYAPRSFADAVRFRNSIVTGSAPGGLSFRGDVGYTDPFAFRGELGSNELFEFRRDSIYSGLGGIGIRGTDALQYQFALTTGQSVPTGLARSLTVPRSGGGANSGDILGTRGQDPLIPSTPSYLQGSPTAAAATLRSTAAYLTNRDLQPELLRTLRDRTGARFTVSASPLNGIRVDETSHAELVDPSFRKEQEQVRYAAPRAIEPRPNAAAESRAVTPYDALTQRLNDAAPLPRPGETPDAEEGPATTPGAPSAAPQQPWWQQQVDTLRRELDDAERDALQPKIPDPRAPALDIPSGEEGSDLNAPAPVPPTPKELEAQARSRPVFDAETLRLIREARGQTSTLVPQVEGYDAYADHMATAERLFKDGRYFDAEARFTAALSVRPGDPTARVGRVHAQIGAGLLLSAGQNLRMLLRDHPELATMIYDEALLPEAKRLGMAEDAMRDQFGVVGPVANEAALLLAYTGYQRGNEAQVREGLDWLSTTEAPDAGGAIIQKVPDPIADLLRGVWLEEPPAPPPPADPAEEPAP